MIIKLFFVNQYGSDVAVWSGEAGISLLQAAQEVGVDLEGACEGNMACATCHVILPEDLYKSLPEPSEDEEEMLDFVDGLHSRSRLGCQLIIDESYHDKKIRVE